MAQETQKELLKEIIKYQETNANTLKENAKRQLDFAADVSDFMNKQYLHNTRIRGFLESDSTTNQEGLIEKVNRLEKDINGIKSTTNKRMAFIAGITAVIVPAGKWLLTKLFL